MKSKVYFVGIKDIKNVPESLSKLELLIKKAMSSQTLKAAGR